MKHVLLLILIATLSSCSSGDQKFEINQEYLGQFKKNVKEGLAYNRPYYLQLISFSKLDPMTVNQFGSDKDNEHVLEVEKAPPVFGSLEVFKDSVLFKAFEGLEIKTENDSVISQMVLIFNDSGNTIDLYHDRYSWRVVAYGEDKYLRVRDLESDALKEFTGYQRFDLTSDFIFKAKFTPYDPPRVVVVPSSVDFERTATFIGTISFEYRGEEYTLDVQDGHIMFSDETSAIQTYGSGRYLKFSEPTEDGTVILDFNYAYNPPCIFSRHTTCLFPPAQNRLSFEVLAGETTGEL